MSILLTQADLEYCARTVAIVGLDQSDDIQSSIAWVIRNRASIDQSDLNETPPVGPVCNAILDEALTLNERIKAEMRLPVLDWNRIRAANYLVWNGNVTDQTRGATSCHRHDKTPSWAKRRTPTALLGAFLFFR